MSPRQIAEDRLETLGVCFATLAALMSPDGTLAAVDRDNLSMTLQFLSELHAEALRQVFQTVESL